jgi:hypothetical protein
VARFGYADPPGLEGTLAKPRPWKPEEEMLPPLTLERKQTGESLDTLKGNFKRMTNLAGEIIGLEYGDDNVLKQQALQYARGTFKGAPNVNPQQILDVALKQYETLKNVNKQDAMAKRVALWDAKEKGGLLNITDVSAREFPQEMQIRLQLAKDASPDRLPEILSGPMDNWNVEELKRAKQYSSGQAPLEHIPGYMKPFHAIGTGGRMAQSGAATGVQQLRKEALAQPSPPPGFWGGVKEGMERGAMSVVDPFMLVPGRREALLTRAGTALAGTGVPGAVGDALERTGEALNAAGEAIGPGPIGYGLQFVGMTPKGIGVAMPRPQKQLLGRDPEQMARAFEDPASMSRIAKETAVGVVEGLSFQQHARLEKTLQAIADELGPERTEKDLMAAALEHPTIAQLAYEVTADPLNLVGGFILKYPLRGLGYLGRQVARVPGISHAVETVAPIGRGLKKAFTWFPEAKAMKEAGHEQAGLAMELARMEADAPAKAAGEIAGGVRTLQKLTKNPEDAKLLAKALSGDLLKEFKSQRWSYDKLVAKFGDDPARIDDILGKDPVATARALLPEHLHKPFDVAQGLSGQLKQAGKAAHTLRRWEDVTSPAGQQETILKEAGTQKPYFPKRVMTEEGAKTLEARRAFKVEEDVSAAKQLMERAALKSKAPASMFVQDPGLQYTKRVEDFAKRAPAAKEMLLTHEYTAAKGVFKKAPKDVSKVGYILRIPKNLSENARYAMKTALESQTGMKWDSMNKALRDTYQKVTGRVGLKLGKYDNIAPEFMLKRFQQLMPVIGGEASEVQKAYKVFNEFSSRTIRPFMNFFRPSVTLMGGPGYFLRNTAGAVGLGTLAHGMRVLHPQHVKATALGTLASAGFGADWARAQKYVLPGSGKKKTIGWMLDQADRIGFIDQQDMRAGLEMLMGQGKVGRFVQKATEFMSPIYLPMGKRFSQRNMARATENFQKLIVFAGFLKDDTPQALMKAAKLTADYAADYRRLSPFEKHVLKDSFAFYAWNRFIMPHYVKQLTENPQRLAKFAQTRLAAYRASERKQPPEQAVMPYLKLAGVPAPESQQPQRSKIPGMGTKDFAMWSIEDPHTMGLGVMQMVLSALKGEAGMMTVAEQTSVAPQLAVELFTGRDFRTGEKLGSLFDAAVLMKDLNFMTGIKEAKRSAVARALTAPVRRWSRNFENLYRLYYKEADLPAEAADLALRYKVGRDFWIFAHAFNIAAEAAHGHEIPGAIVSPIPGIGKHPLDVTRRTAAASSRAVSDIPKTEKQLTR